MKPIVSTIAPLAYSGGKIDLAGRPKIMGVLNLTPDSFSDGGANLAPQKALAYAKAMIAQGADMIDIGGQSSRPGAIEISIDEELSRVVPVISALRESTSVPLSIDTNKPEVMQAAIVAGASMINDINALRAPNALQVAAKLGVPVCLMHMQGQPSNMQASPAYQDVVKELITFFQERVSSCQAAGIDRNQLLIDPGFGFGKTLAHNLVLLRELAAFHQLELPLVVGLSRKSMIGDILDKPVGERLSGSLAAAMIAAFNGAHIIRVHDVAATHEVLSVLQTVYSKE